jgi:hypothetical protein
MEPEECSEVPTGTFRCELQRLPCESNADCPGTLECFERLAWSCGGAGTGGGVATGGVGGGGAVTGGVGAPPQAEPEADAGTEPGGSGGFGGPSCEYVVFEKTCGPDDSYYPPPSGGGGQGGTTGSAGMGSSADAGVPTMPGSGSAGASAAGAGGSGGTAGGPASGPGEGDDDHGWLPRLGCAVAGKAATEALWSSFVMFGLVALVLRRRARGR